MLFDLPISVPLDNFGDLLFRSYAGISTVCFALRFGYMHYNNRCVGFRKYVYKQYKSGKWQIHDLTAFNIGKLRSNNKYCYYCGCRIMDKSNLEADHILPKSKGGSDNVDNILMLCKSCNASKGKTDLLEWYTSKFNQCPDLFILSHYVKLIYDYAIVHNLLSKTLAEIDGMTLPFNYRCIPVGLPEPEYFYELYYKH